MRITVRDFFEGAQHARGIAVIIDVFKAFSVVCYAFANGVSRIIPVGKVEEAFELKDRFPDRVLIGERNGKKLPGFAYGNSPAEIQPVNFSGKTLIHTTHAGTQGLIHASQVTQIVTGAFVNAAATARYLRHEAPREVTLVRMGLQARARTDEDDLCAEYLIHLLTGELFESQLVKERLRQSPCSNRFFDPDKPWSPPGDFERCLDIDR
jgi:2-phosphosulfolactate phosphatase